MQSERAVKKEPSLNLIADLMFSAVCGEEICLVQPVVMKPACWCLHVKSCVLEFVVVKSITVFWAALKTP
jgi:hypothetical protein